MDSRVKCLHIDRNMQDQTPVPKKLPNRYRVPEGRGTEQKPTQPAVPHDFCPTTRT